MTESLSNGPICPMPISQRDTIILGHGSGGKLTHDLIKNVFHRFLSNPLLDQNDDSARISLSSDDHILAVSTDGHVVKPIFFPGGDIGRLSICGTVNDIAMVGAVPKYLTASFILEEGLPISTLEKVLESMADAAREADVVIIAGDTKVVEKGYADQIYISTAGFGVIDKHQAQLSGNNAKPGDKIIISGTLGDHGIAVLSARNELDFNVSVQSDISPLNHIVKVLLEFAPHTHVLRDPTRGGLGTTLNEIANQSHVSIRIEEQNIPVKPAVKAACEMLGFDPLYLANEGKFLAIVPPDEAVKALECIRNHPYGRDAAIIGEVQENDPGRVILITPYGTTRIISMLSGEILPRIC